MTPTDSDPDPAGTTTAPTASAAPTAPTTTTAASDALHGLSVGDALGAQFFVPANRPLLGLRQAPPGPWPWTDDTEMACSVHAAVRERGHIDTFDLTHAFARRHDFDRGYGPAANRMLRLIREGGDARRLAAALFDGQGSYGNGAAMRVAPLGAAHAADPAGAAGPAADTAVITHTHPQAVDGAVAVAVAAALAAGSRGAAPAPAEFLAEVCRLVPHGAVRRGTEEAIGLLGTDDPYIAARLLGNGSRVSAADTVPLALWAAARNLGDYPRAVWDVITAGGDVDTTAAITGGIVAAHTGTAGIPAAWLAAREPLPAWAAPVPGSVAGPVHRPPLAPVLMPRPVPPDALRRAGGPGGSVTPPWTEEDWQRIRSTGATADGRRYVYTAEGVLHLHDRRTGYGLLDVVVAPVPRTGREPVFAVYESHPGSGAPAPEALVAELYRL